VTEADRDEWRYLSAGFVVVLAVVVAQVAGWLVYRAVHDDPTALELTEKCLRREKLLPIEPVEGDPIAARARGGALATRVEGNGVHVAIATSQEKAAELANAYLATAGRRIELRLERRGKVVYVWELAREPSPTQRQTMYDCQYG
jgi:hypothetical protein